MVTSSGPIFAIVNQDIHLSREVAIDCNAWPLYKDSKVKVEIVTMAQRRRNPNPNYPRKSNLLPYKAISVELVEAAPPPPSRTNHRGGREGFERQEKRLKEEQARLAAENGVSFDYEDVDGDNVNENENNEKKDGAVVKKKNDMSNKYIYKKDTSSKDNKNNDDETTTATNEGTNIGDGDGGDEDGGTNNKKKEFKVIDTAALLQQRKEQKRKENEKQMNLSKKKIAVLKKQVKTYREMLKKVTGNEKMELMIMNKITKSSKTLEEEEEKLDAMSV
eukprot:g15129.t1